MADAEINNLDDMLAYVGDFSRYQAILIALFSVINVLSAFHYFGQTFTTLVPDYTCSTLDYNQEDVVTALECSIRFSKNESDVYIEKPCTDGWIYNTSNFAGFVSIVQEVKNLNFCSNISQVKFP